MEDFSRYLDIKTTTLICCVFWIFSAAEAKTIMETVGSRATLPCKNHTQSNITQLTWKINGSNLFSYRPGKMFHMDPQAQTLNITMSQSEDQLYALIIDRAEMSHTGNYTCEATTTNGVESQTWELIITDAVAASYHINPLIPVAVAVPCICCIIFVITLAIIRKACKTPTLNSNPSVQCPCAEMQKQPEDIYENCLKLGVSQRSNHQQQNHTAQ